EVEALAGSPELLGFGLRPRPVSFLTAERATFDVGLSAHVLVGSSPAALWCCCPLGGFGCCFSSTGLAGRLSRLVSLLRYSRETTSSGQHFRIRASSSALCS